MIIEYDVFCFERTLTINFPDKYEGLKDTILEALDTYYTDWHNSDEDSCLEQYMVDRLCEEHNLGYNEWDSIPYGDDYEPREHLWVCDYCLMAIWSREGNQATLKHYVDETDAVESKCDWCNDHGFSELYELV